MHDIQISQTYYCASIDKTDIWFVCLTQKCENHCNVIERRIQFLAKMLEVECLDKVQFFGLQGEEARSNDWWKKNLETDPLQTKRVAKAEAVFKAKGR
uniref:Uncharacterized protein n=1 Tax=Romanomermis culicivorax TaxID=13658 RepID=A0A915I9T5_ROMCU